MNTPSGPRVESYLPRVTAIACASAALTAFLVLLGWLFAVPVLTSLAPGYPTMNPLTAICVILVSASLWVLRERNPSSGAALAARICAAAVVTLGAVRFFTVVSGVELHVDQVIFREQLLALAPPSRMGTYSAIACVCLGTGLLMFDIWGGRPAGWLVSTALAVTALGLVGYLYGAPMLHGFMAMNTSFAFAVLSLAALLARPERGLCALLLSASPGGVMARRVLPVAVVVPFTLGWLRLQGQRAGLYGLEVGTGLLALVIVGVMVRLVGVTGRRLDAADGERRRAESALRKSLERQSLLLNANLIGALTVDRDGRITDANEAFLQLIGYTREELPLRWETITPIEWHHRTELAKGEIAEHGRTGPFEKEYVRKDGTRVPALVGGAALDGPDGEIVAFVVDMSGKKRAELEIERMRMFLDSIVENLPNMIFVKDAQELRFVRLNRAGEALLGLSREELMGKNDYDFFPTDQADFFTAKDRSVLDSGQLLDIEEEPIQTKSGERILHTKKVPILDPLGVPRYLLGISEDITAHKEAQKELAVLNEGLQKRTQELEAANKELESFSYSVSHDLRAPLRHIDGFADLLARQSGHTMDETGRRYLDTISSSAKQMGRLIDDLLSFSRMSRTRMQQSMVDVGRLVAEAKETIQAETAGKDITWQIAPLPSLHCDAGMMRLVFTNLLSNAVKYSGRRPHARIEVGFHEADGEIVIFVRDNGVGFDMNYAHKLFGVFQRLHSDDEFEGTGIGLANVQRIIHRHGGRTWAEGEVDRGATFYVALPRDAKIAQEEATEWIG